MSKVARFAAEYSRLGVMLEPVDFARLLGETLLAAPAVLRTGKLAPVDRRMKVDVAFTYRGVRIRVPCRAMDAQLTPLGDTPTFGGIREMLCNDVYFRAFSRLPEGGDILDLGANRGMFSTVAKGVLGARLAVGVEPEPSYVAAAPLLYAANGIDPATVPREVAFIAAQPGPGRVTVAEILARYAITRFSFVKCDIEGGEYDVLLHANEWLARVDHLAMELHGDAVGNVAIADALARAGLSVLPADQFGRRTAAEAAEYLYAARDPSVLKG